MLAGKRKFIFLPSVSFVSLVIIIIISAVCIPFLRNSIIDGLSLPLKFLSHINQEVGGLILYHRNLVQNQRLEKEIGLMHRQAFESQELYLENVRLRHLLDFKEKSVYPLTAAGVIGYDPANLSSLIIIDKGRRHKIRPGCAVITNEGLIGRIIEAGDFTSKVLLINDVDSGVGALIQRSRQKGLVTGTLAGRLILRYLPPEADVQVSDFVITSGLSGLYPKGILIGMITGIQDAGSSPEVFAVVQPSSDLTRLEEVLVVLQD